MRRHPPAFLVLLCTALGCGTTTASPIENSNESAVEPGEGGADGDGGGGGGPVPDPTPGCEEMCLEEAECIGSVEDCIASCEEGNPWPECEKEIWALMNCMDTLDQIGCTVDPNQYFEICGEADAAWKACAGHTSCFLQWVEDGESEEDGTCETAGICLDHEAETACQAGENDVIECDCIMNETVIGTCVEPWQYCPANGGCCVAVFAAALTEP